MMVQILILETNIGQSNMRSEDTVSIEFTVNTHSGRTMFTKCKIGKRPGKERIPEKLM